MEPCPSVCTGFLCSQNSQLLYDPYSVESDIKPQINKQCTRNRVNLLMKTFLICFTTLSRLKMSMSLEYIHFVLIIIKNSFFTTKTKKKNFFCVLKKLFNG